MSKIAQFSILQRLSGAVRRHARLFVRRQDGATAIEFAMVALPFFALMFAILETALVFFAGQTLQAAAGEAGRLIMTGQAQQANYTAADFKDAVCQRIYALFNCSSGMTVDVKTYADFQSAANGVNTTPTTNGKFDSSKTGYAAGGPGCIQVVTLYYQWPVLMPMLALNSSNVSGNYRLLQATAVFRNEPFPNGGSFAPCP